MAHVVVACQHAASGSSSNQQEAQKPEHAQDAALSEQAADSNHGAGFMNPSRGEGDATDTRSGASEGDRLPSQKKTGQPNPYHTLGDAMQFWHRH